MDRRRACPCWRRVLRKEPGQLLFDTPMDEGASAEWMASGRRQAHIPAGEYALQSCRIRAAHVF